MQWWSLLKLHKKLHRCISFLRSCHRNHQLLNTTLLIQEPVWGTCFCFFCLIPASILFWPSSDCRSISKTAYFIIISKNRNSNIKRCISHLNRVLTHAIATHSNVCAALVVQWYKPTFCLPDSFSYTWLLCAYTNSSNGSVYIIVKFLSSYFFFSLSLLFLSLLSFFLSLCLVTKSFFDNFLSTL